MNNISLKDFLDRVKERLTELSHGDLRDLIIAWAKKTTPAKRMEFLSSLSPPPSKMNAPEPDEELLEEINAFSERVENGDYCNGWGWDDAIREERDWGDESWAEESEDLFARAREALLDGYCETAKNAYHELFNILEMGQEPGHLPGHPDLSQMLGIDLAEECACFLRAVYLAAPLEDRPEQLLAAWNEYGYFADDRLSLQGMIEAGEEPLPDFDRFLPAWIDYLREIGTEHDLLREAVKMSGGVPALAALARQEGKAHPKNYVEWIKALEEEKNYPAMLEAAGEGLATVPQNYVVRAEIARGMVKAAENLGDTDSQLVGWREAFYSKPDLDFFLNLLSLAEQKGCRQKEAEPAIARAMSLVEEENQNRGYYYPESKETIKSQASKSLLVQICLLSGHYEKAFAICREEGPLGWSFGQNPKGILIPFFLVLLAGDNGIRSLPNLKHLWENAAGTVNEQIGTQLPKRYSQAIENIIKNIQLTEEEENKYLNWCIAEAEARLNEIVGGQHRGSYNKAANLIVSVAELLAVKGNKQRGAELINKYHQKYNRHRAFRQELKDATARSGIY